MNMVPLRDLCRQARENVRPGQRSELRYIGMETIESGTGLLVDGALSKTPSDPIANSFRFGPEHVLYGKLRPYLNKVHVPEFEGRCSTEIIPLLPAENIERRYLAFFLRSQRVVAQISARTAGARMPRADMDFIFSLTMPKVVLARQIEVVDVLQRAESIVHLRRTAEQKAAELVPALFEEMFGDPAANAKRYPLRPVSDFVSRFEGGKNLQAGSEAGSAFRILKVSAVTSGTYLEQESKPSPNLYQPPENHIVREGDMLFSRANTEALVGATAIVEYTNGATLLPDKLWRFVWSEPVEPIYVHALFQSSSVRRALSKLSTGTSASMRNISQAKLFKLRLPIAPLDAQKRFAELAAGVQAIKAQHAMAFSKASATFDAMLAAAFPG